MDSIQEDNKQIQSDSSEDDSLAVVKTLKKRKLSPDKSRKQPPKKRIRKTSGQAARNIL